MGSSQTFTPEFKAQIVLDILTGARSTAELSREYGIADSVLSRWKQLFVENAPLVFIYAEKEPDPKDLLMDDSEALRALYAEVADEDVALANMGLEDYNRILHKIDEGIE